MNSSYHPDSKEIHSRPHPPIAILNYFKMGCTDLNRRVAAPAHHTCTRDTEVNPYHSTCAHSHPNSRIHPLPLPHQHSSSSSYSNRSFSSADTVSSRCRRAKPSARGGQPCFWVWRCGGGPPSFRCAPSPCCLPSSLFWMRRVRRPGEGVCTLARARIGPAVWLG